MTVFKYNIFLVDNIEYLIGSYWKDLVGGIPGWVGSIKTCNLKQIQKVNFLVYNIIVNLHQEIRNRAKIFF